MLHKIVLATLLLLPYQAFSKSLPKGFLKKHPELTSVVQSLKLNDDDWPDVDQKTLVHCLSDIKTKMVDNPIMDLDQKLNVFEDCAKNWSTVEMKKPKKDM